MTSNPADVQDIVERLRAYRPTNEWGDGVHHVICIQAAAEIERLRAENFVLAAGSCDVKGGKIGDERGNFYCTLEAALQQSRSAVIEECARIAEETDTGYFDARTFTAQKIAKAIRALAE